jgi:hypothetical protein
MSDLTVRELKGFVDRCIEREVPMEKATELLQKYAAKRSLESGKIGKGFHKRIDQLQAAI